MTPEPAPAPRDLLACLEVGKLLTSTLELSHILQLILTRMSELIPAQNWSLFLRDEATGELTFAAVAGLDPQAVAGLRLGRGEGIAGHVAETGEPLFLPDVRQDPRFCRKVDDQTGFTTRTLLAVPLTTHGKVVGVIEIVNFPAEVSAADRELPALKILADYAAIAIENSRLVEETRRLSVTDDYTGLPNARYLHELLDRLIATAEPFAVVFIDLDDFKAVVDRHGHLMGSRALREVGEAIAAGLAPPAVLTKYGGDEYVLVLPGLDRAEARTTVERVREILRNRLFLADQPEPVRLTASFGLAHFPEDAREKRTLLCRADAAMYRVKRSNKDGVGLA